MRYYQKLAEEINNFTAITLAEDEKFFMDPVMNQLIIIHDLLIFPYIEHEKFQQYIGWFRNDIRKDINRCLNSPLHASADEKLELLNAMKARIKPKLKVVEFAFSYYLDKKDLLKKESGAEIRRIKMDEILPPLKWLSVSFKK
jgi:hypothetical protein